MGFRFQRRLNLGGGWGLNASRSGGSLSYRSQHGAVGTKGFSLRTGIPGLSFRQNWGKDSGVVVAAMVLIIAVAAIAVQVLIYLVPIVWQCLTWIGLTAYDLCVYAMRRIGVVRHEPSGFTSGESLLVRESGSLSPGVDSLDGGRMSNFVGGILGAVIVGSIAMLVANCSGNDAGAANSVAPIALEASSAKPSALPEPLPEPLLEPLTEPESPKEMYIASRSVNQRSSPNGSVVGKISGGSSVQVYEEKGGWSRISAAGVIPALWVASRMLCTGSGCYSAVPARLPAESLRRSRSNFIDGSCPCSGARVCVGPRGGRYCITSGGRKRYGV